MVNRTRSDSPTKLCTQPGCDRALRARGLCASHYNQTYHPDRHAPHPTACANCDAPVSRPFGNRRRPTCSVACRSALQWGSTPTGGYDWAERAESRARQAGARIVHRFDRTEVFARDGMTCQGCGIECSKPDPYVQTSATVDHIVPLSKGGDHTMANVQTLCLLCNSTKQDG